MTVQALGEQIQQGSKSIVTPLPFDFAESESLTQHSSASRSRAATSPVIRISSKRTVCIIFLGTKREKQHKFGLQYDKILLPCANNSFRIVDASQSPFTIHEALSFSRTLHEFSWKKRCDVACHAKGSMFASPLSALIVLISTSLYFLFAGFHHFLSSLPKEFLTWGLSDCLAEGLFAWLAFRFALFQAKSVLAAPLSSIFDNDVE